MKTLFTPWRIEHVLGRVPKPSGCLFEPPGNRPHDKENLILYRDTTVIILLNRFPYSNGHLLVAPRRHIDCITQMDASEHGQIMAMIEKSVSILRDTLRPDGFNIGCNIGAVAGAGIADHLHFHVVPRWQGDHNYMTVIADIRTIPEHIDATFQKLLPHFQNLHEQS